MTDSQTSDSVDPAVPDVPFPHPLLEQMLRNEVAFAEERAAHIRAARREEGDERA